MTLLELPQIVISDLRVKAYHGVYASERTQGAMFSVTLRLWCHSEDAIYSDDLSDTVDYGTVCDLVNREMAIPSQLLEHVAGRILTALLTTCPRVEQATVSVTKEQPPLVPAVAAATVTITATR